MGADLTVQSQTNSTLAVSKATPQGGTFSQAHPGVSHQKAREALLPLLRGVYHTTRKDCEVLLTIDAGWRNDSLSIEYKFYKGQNLLTPEPKFLVEKIYFTLNPAEINELETVTDEFLFLYLRNNRRVATVSNLTTTGLSASAIQRETWTSSCGFPVRQENVQQIIQYLKEFRETP
jgi:hypothetical protein